MEELIKVTQNDNGVKIVSARELHEGLEIKTEFRKWFPRMCEYGFDENIDYARVSQKCPTLGGVQEKVDYAITLDMAKHIAMIQRTELGKKYRQYFIECEKQLIEIKDSYMISDPVERAKRWIEEEQERQRLALENKELTKEVIHKEDVIIGLVDEISLADKRQILNRVVRYNGAKYSERWNALYREFENKFHINLKRRYDTYNENNKPKMKSKLDYIDKVMNKIPELYDIACKLYENDVNALVEEMYSLNKK